MSPLVLTALLVAGGTALIALARWAARRPGTRWESLIALRAGDVLITEVVGAFVIGYALGGLLVSPDRGGPPGRGPGPRGGFLGASPQLIFGMAAAALAVLIHIDFSNLAWSGRATRNPVSSYIGWDARVIERIPRGGFGRIALRDGVGNVMSVAATADSDLAEGTVVRVVTTRDLNLVVAPAEP